MVTFKIFKDSSLLRHYLITTVKVLSLASFLVTVAADSNDVTNGKFMQRKIAGGTSAQDGQFRFAANIHIRGSSACGGSIIGSTWLLTAAHCLVDPTASAPEGSNVLYPISDMALNLGSLSNSTESPVGIKRTIPHPQYSYNDTLFDFGLIELDQTLKLGGKLQAIRLLRSDISTAPTQSYTAVGWGRDANDNRSPTLQRVDLPAADTNTCTSAKPDYTKMLDQVLCVGDAHGKDTCRGDSGGPLLIRIGAEDNSDAPISGSWGQLAVTSFGANGEGKDSELCGLEGSVGFYAKTGFALSWISSVTGIPLNQLAASSTLESNQVPQSNSSGSSSVRSDAPPSSAANQLSVSLLGQPILFVALSITCLASVQWW